VLEELATLYREHLGDFTRVATAIVGDADAARDAVQDAFATAVRKRRSFRREGTLDAWVWRIVVSAARDVRRRRSRKQPDVQELILARADDLGLPLHRLSERQREVLFLHYYADLNYAAIASALGISEGTVGATLHAARTTLREALTQEVSR
jgi:RNA polymerase sigma-70 factor (ECF subfamily)